MTTVAENVPETRLDRWLEEAPRSWNDIVKVFLDVGEKLTASHAQGLVYQELRLENIIIGADGRGDVRNLQPAILDTPKVGPGSVRTAAVSLEQRLADMKSTESVAYLAPEQFRGRTADPRSNQFSFGVALYRALYRQSPFDHEWAVSQAGESRRTPLGSIHFDLLIQSFDRATLINLAREVLSGNLRPPPEETDVPPWLEQILRRVLQTDPEERYPSLRQLLDDIAHEAGALSAAPVVERRPAPRKWAIIGGVGVVVFLVGLLAIWLGRR